MGLAIIFTGLGFMAGNEIGAANGLADLTTLPVSVTGLIVGIIAIATIWVGTPKLLEVICQFFVVAMGFLFVITMFLSKPDWGKVASGIVPTQPYKRYGTYRYYYNCNKSCISFYGLSRKI